jgi:hypothetical protein
MRDPAEGGRRACPRHRRERVVHCEYTPYAPEGPYASGPFDNGAPGWSGYGRH